MNLPGIGGTNTTTGAWFSKVTPVFLDLDFLLSMRIFYIINPPRIDRGTDFKDFNFNDVSHNDSIFKN